MEKNYFNGGCIDCKFAERDERGRFVSPCSGYSNCSWEKFEGKVDPLTEEEKYQRIAELEEESSKLQEQLKNAIVLPKNFDIGQTVFMIPSKSNGLINITAYKILCFSKSEIGFRADLSLIKKGKGLEPYFSASFEMFNKIIFANEAKAQKYLIGV